MSLPESTAVILLRRFSTDTQLDVAAEKLTNCARTFKQYLGAVIVNLLSFSFGTVIGWPAPSQPLLQAEVTPIGGDPLSDETVSWLASVMCFGAMIGTFLFGWLSDRLGRKAAGLIGAIPYMASWLSILLADDVMWLYVGRVLAGLAGGASLVVCPLYVGETAEDALRGLLGSLFSIANNAGIVFAFIVGSYVSFHTFAIICLVLPGLFFVLFLGLPDTPVYLLSRGSVPKAVKSLTWFRGGRADLVDDELARMVANMKESTGSAAAASCGVFQELFCTRAALKALLIVMGLFTVQQFCGVIAIISYTVEIFSESGSSLEPTTATMIVGGLQLMGVCVSGLVVDRAGRRLLLITSCLGMFVCLAVLGGCFYMKAMDFNLSSIGWLPVTALSIFIVAYALGLGPVPFILVSELFSSNVRSLSTSFNISWASILAFLVTKFYSNMCASMGVYGSMWVFSGCCLIGAVFTYFLVPETKGKSLETILRELEGRTAPKAPPMSLFFNPPPGDIHYTRTDEAEASL